MNYRTIVVITVLLPAQLLQPCTGIFLKTKNGSYVYARTLEFGQDLQSKILLMPHNYTITAPAPSSTKGLTWTTKYAALGTNAFGLESFVDGVNEVGLAGGLFYFPGFAQYQHVMPERYHQSLPMWQLLTWILTSCATIDEVRHALPTIIVSDAPITGTNETIPAHLIVHDRSGKSLVVEYIKGTLHMHENPLGVITNAPNFDWHMTNLRNYINLSPVNAPDKKLAGITLPALGQGSGLLGLPGDFTPPSRFVRAALFNTATPTPANESDAIHQAFSILNNFDIPKGVATDARGTSDYTLWTSAIDMTNKTFYFRTHGHFQLCKAALADMNTDAPAPMSFSMEQPEHIITITPEGE